MRCNIANGRGSQLTISLIESSRMPTPIPCRRYHTSEILRRKSARIRETIIIAVNTFTNECCGHAYIHSSAHTFAFTYTHPRVRVHPNTYVLIGLRTRACIACTCMRAYCVWSSNLPIKQYVHAYNVQCLFTTGK